MNKRQNFIFGIRTVLEALRTGQHFERVFIQKGLKGELYQELMAALHKTSNPISKVPVERINKFTTKNHQGVLALISPIQYYKIDQIVPSLFEEGKTPLILVLDQITDIRNFGAICRTAECHGVHTIVIPAKGGAQINADAIKTSAGALHHLPICRASEIASDLDYLKKSGFSITACSEKGRKKIDQLRFTDPTAIILGSEENGISSELFEYSDQIGSIPLHGEISSLNVSVAAGIILYEANRQRSALV
ncbi:MAG: 23S rRNA (guanosine(2251)-2'-O)-methyltransferase RlmB [Bacteroidota bacterium]